MTDKDKQWQDQFDRRPRFEPQADPDAQAYRRLYEALDQPPTGSLPENFADRVVAQVALRPQAAYHPLLWTAAAVVLSLLLSALAVYYTDTVFFKSMTSQLLRTKEVIAFSGAAFALVQLADRWLIKKAG